jgi:hypothetical protein
MNSGKCGITLQFNTKWEQNIFTLLYSNLLNENALTDRTSVANRRTAEQYKPMHKCMFKGEVLQRCNTHVSARA